VSKQRSNFDAKRLYNPRIREESAQNVHKAVGFGTEFLIQFSPHLTPFSDREDDASSIKVVSASLFNQLKREKAGSCTQQNVSRPIFLLILALF
jgi:hypothetical protein